MSYHSLTGSNKGCLKRCMHCMYCHCLSPCPPINIPLSISLCQPRLCQHESSGGIVTTPVQEVAGAAALEFVGRWLGGNLPHSGPALQTLRHISSVATAAGGSQDGGSSKGIVGRTMADAVSRPSALAMVSCSTGQRL